MRSYEALAEEAKDLIASLDSFADKCKESATSYSGSQRTTLIQCADVVRGAEAMLQLAVNAVAESNAADDLLADMES